MKTKSGKNRTAAPINAREILVCPANQILAGTAMLPARIPAIPTSPNQK